MVLRRIPHAVYDTLYHLVWSPKYRHDVLQGAIQRRVEELFADIAEQYDITIEELEVSPDHVHIFCSFSPRYSIAQVVTRFKSLSARASSHGSNGVCGVENSGKMAILLVRWRTKSLRK